METQNHVNPHENRDLISLQYEAGRGAQTSNGQVIFQRQGTSENFHCDLESGLSASVTSAGHLTITQSKHNGRGSFDTLFSGETGSMETALNTYAEITEHSVHSTIAAYMYSENVKGWLGNEKIFTAAFYCAYSNTIRHIGKNYCILMFGKSGKFEEANFQFDAAVKHLIPFVEDSLKIGFHQNDLDKGDRYCKRRLAWLVGAGILTQEKAGCFMEGDMETFSQ